MVQRKENAAARAALARRRQRAAQTIHRPELSSSSATTEKDESKQTSTRDVITTTNSNIDREPQNTASLSKLKSAEKETLCLSNKNDTRANRSITHCENLQSSPNRRKISVERRKLTTEQLPIISDASFHKSKALNLSNKKKENNDTIRRSMSSPFTANEYNIETVLQSDIPNSSSMDVLEQQGKGKGRNDTLNRHHNTTSCPTTQQTLSPMTKKVKQTSSSSSSQYSSPQSTSSRTFPSQHNQSTQQEQQTIYSEQQNEPVSVDGSKNRAFFNPISRLKPPDVQYRKNLEAPSSMISTTKKDSYRKEMSSMHCSKQKLSGKVASNKNNDTAIQFTTVTKNTREISETEKRTLRNKVDHSVGSTSSTVMTSFKASRIPSPNPINPHAGQLLPKRNDSPSKRRIPPEERLSPRRFRLPKPQPRQQQQQNSDPVPIKGKRTNTQDKSSNQFDKPNRIQALLIEKSKTDISIVRPEPNNLRSQVDAQVKPTAEKLDKKANTIMPTNSSSQIDEELSAYLMDSFSITDAALIPDDEPVQQALVAEESDLVITSPNVSDINDENGAKKFHAIQSIPCKAQQTVIDKKSPTRRNVPIAFGNNLRPIDISNRDIPRNEREFIDATCLRSGDFIMLRSCSSIATIRAIRNNELVEINGSGLGKYDEMLKITKIGDTSFSPLKYGDVVVILSLIDNVNDSNDRALSVRSRRDDVDGINEIGFFGVGDKKSDCWVILPIESGKSVVVGRAAVLSQTQHRKRCTPEPVKSGNPVMLLNCFNGGLLSIINGVTALITDSYQSTGKPHSGHPSLLGSLEALDRIQPSISEAFQLLAFSVPPCPSWIMSKGLGERSFLNGSYLSEPLRNQSNFECDGKLFGSELQTRIPFNELKDITVNQSLPLKSKENILVDEVIGSFLGLEGLFIRLKENEKEPADNNFLEFYFSDTSVIVFDLSLRNLVNQILPLSTSYVCIRKFVGSHYPGYEYGRVMQAFCEGLDYFLDQFVSFVAQLEHKARNPSATNKIFTMKNIHFEVTPLLHSMSILEQTTNAVRSKKGGDLINALRSLEKCVFMGDTVAKDLLKKLLDRTSVPYANMLSTWLQSGLLYDPYEEFMVKQSSGVKNLEDLDGDTWSALFTINEEHVIVDIVRNDKLKERILMTGKYWNAVQICDADAKLSQEARSRPLELNILQFQSDMSSFSAYIDSMYQRASENLIQILRDKFELKESLQIMKRYFLLDQGDFLVNLLEATEEELAKPFEDVSIRRIQNFLGTSIQTTEAQRDVEIYSSDSFHVRVTSGLNPNSLRCRLSKQSLLSYVDSNYGTVGDQESQIRSQQANNSHNHGMTGIELFEIDFPRVPFPISLFLSRTLMKEYKLLFRHLFYAKHVERRLVRVWSDHQALKKLDAVRGLLGPTFMLRQRMLHFVQSLINYMTFEVIESNWLEMSASINISQYTPLNQKEQTVDDLLNMHTEFLQKTINACLLRNPIILQSLIKLLNTCLLFSDQMKRFMDTTKIVSFSDSIQPCKKVFLMFSLKVAVNLLFFLCQTFFLNYAQYDDSINLAAEKRGAVQRILNDRRFAHSSAPDKKKLRRALMSLKEERDILQQRQTRRVGREICSDSYKRMIRRFEEVFNTDLLAFMALLDTHTSFDWNGFLSANIPVQNQVQ